MSPFLETEKFVIAEKWREGERVDESYFGQVEFWVLVESSVICPVGSCTHELRDLV